MAVGTQAMGLRGYRQRGQETEASTATRDGGPITMRDGDSDSYRGGGVIDGKSGSNWQGGAHGTEPERDMYRGGAVPKGVTNVGAGDGVARLTVAKGVALHETCTGETTSECRNDGGGELPSDTWEE